MRELYPMDFCKTQYEKTGRWLPSCPPMPTPYMAPTTSTTPATTTTTPATTSTTPVTESLNLTATDPTDPPTLLDLVTNVTVTVANYYVDAETEKIVPPASNPRTTWDYIFRISFFGLVVPGVSLILLSLLSLAIWMGLKCITPDRNERAKNVFYRGGCIAQGLGVGLIKMFICMRDACCFIFCCCKARPALDGRRGDYSPMTAISSSNDELATVSSEVLPRWHQD